MTDRQRLGTLTAARAGGALLHEMAATAQEVKMGIAGPKVTATAILAEHGLYVATAPRYHKSFLDGYLPAADKQQTLDTIVERTHADFANSPSPDFAEAAKDGRLGPALIATLGAIVSENAVEAKFFNPLPKGRNQEGEEMFDGDVGAKSIVYGVEGAGDEAVENARLAAVAFQGLLIRENGFYPVTNQGATVRIYGMAEHTIRAVGRKLDELQLNEWRKQYPHLHLPKEPLDVLLARGITMPPELQDQLRERDGRYAAFQTTATFVDPATGQISNKIELLPEDHSIVRDPVALLGQTRRVFNSLIEPLRGKDTKLEQDPNKANRLRSEHGLKLKRPPVDPMVERSGPPESTGLNPVDKGRDWATELYTEAKKNRLNTALEAVLLSSIGPIEVGVKAIRLAVRLAKTGTTFAKDLYRWRRQKTVAVNYSRKIDTIIQDLRWKVAWTSPEEPKA